ncbi:MAG: hypothetical protein ACKVZ0_09655 [Gemmatimonadales bacterium]
MPRLTFAAFLLGLGPVAPLAAQRLPKPEFTRDPTVLVAPSWISVSHLNTIVTPHLAIEFSPVANAVEYRVSRSVDGGPEADIFQSPVAAFLYQGQDCTHTPYGLRLSGHICVYFDRNVKSSVSYTYRVRTIYSGGVASPPSASATRQSP